MKGLSHKKSHLIALCCLLLLLLPISTAKAENGFNQVWIGSISPVSEPHASWGDYDNDGDPDLFVMGSYSSRIYRNNGGGNFYAVADFGQFQAGGSDWGDFDGDGDLDLIFTGYYAGGASLTRLYRNIGNNAFSQVQTAITGVYSGGSLGLDWGDYDKDGDLDLAIMGYVYNVGPVTQIWRNDGGSGFANSGISLTGNAVGHAEWGDYDGDNDLDLFVCGSYAATAMYRNNGGGSFSPASPGLTMAQCNAGGADLGDYDDDGDLDIILTGQNGTYLYRNNGDATYAQLTISGLGGLYYSNVEWADYDFDDDLDFVITGTSSNIVRIYRNNGSDNFTDLGAGLIGVQYAKSYWGDYDEDGDPDVLTIGGGQTMLYRNDVNRAPVLAGIGNQMVDEGATLTFDANATDKETPPQILTYSITGAPADASFNTTTGEFSWIPGESEGGQVYNATLTVTDSGTPVRSDSEAFTITVNETNNAPVLATIEDQTVDEGATLNVDADATDTDDPAQTLTYSLMDGPEGASIDATTGKFSWTVGEADGGQTVDVTVIATDNCHSPASDSETFTITVNEMNDAPELAMIGDRSGYLGETLSFTVEATDVDVPAQTLTFSLEAGAPVGANIDPTSGLFSWILDASVLPGSYAITFNVIDDGTPTLADSETITVTIGELNYLTNYSFETAGATEEQAQGWKPIDTAKSDGRVCNTDTKSYAYEGQCAFQFKTGQVSSVQRRLQHKVDIAPFMPGDVVELRAMVKAANLKAGAALLVKATYTNKKVKIARVALKPGTYAYTPFSVHLTLKKPVRLICVQIQASTATGKFFVDDVAVVRVPTGGGLIPLPAAPDLRGIQ